MNYYLYSYNGSSNPAPVSTAFTITDPGFPMPGATPVLAVCNGALFVRASDGSLQKYNGSTFTNLTSGTGITLAKTVTFGVLNNMLYFAGTTNGTNYHLYRYDESSITLVKTFSATVAQAPGQFAALATGKLYFQANDATASVPMGVELWVLY